MEKTQAEKPKDEETTVDSPSPHKNRSFKVNVDAAIDVEAKTAGSGVVIRDDEWRVVASATKPSRLRCGVSFAEAEATEWGLQAAKEANLASNIIETNSQEIANLVNNKEGSKTEIFWVTTIDMSFEYQNVIF